MRKVIFTILILFLIQTTASVLAEQDATVTAVIEGLRTIGG